MMGDELRLRHKCPSGRPPWEGTGHVIITGGSSEEVSTKPVELLGRCASQILLSGLVANCMHAHTCLILPLRQGVNAIHGAA